MQSDYATLARRSGPPKGYRLSFYHFWYLAARFQSVGLLFFVVVVVVVSAIV